MTQPWQFNWQPFLNFVTSKIQEDVSYARRLRQWVREYLNIERKIKMKDKKLLDDYFQQMMQDVGKECMEGLFSSHASTRQLKTNVLWVTLSGKAQGNSLRHPLYWLSILYWLRDKLPGYNNELFQTSAI